MRIVISAANERGQWHDRAVVRSIPEAIEGVTVLSRLPHISRIEAKISGDHRLLVDLDTGEITRTGRFA